MSLTVVFPPANGARLAALSRSTRVVDVLGTVDRQDVMPAALDHDLRVLHRLGAEADVIVSVDQHYQLPTPVPIVLRLAAFCYGPEARSVLPERYVWDRYAARFLDLVGRVRKVDGRFRPAPRSDAVDPPWLHRLPSVRTWDDFRKAYIT